MLADLAVTVDETATGLRLTLRNTGAAALRVDRFQARGHALTLEDPVVVESRNQPSINNYGEKFYPVPSQFISSVSDAQNYAALLLDTYGDPQQRLRMSWNANEQWEAVRMLDLGSRVTVYNRGVTEEMFIESIAHRLVRGGQHDVEMILTPALDIGQVMLLDVGPGLGTGVLAR